MKRKTTLSVSEFLQMVEQLCSSSVNELLAARERMDALRGEQLPPG